MHLGEKERYGCCREQDIRRVGEKGGRGRAGVAIVLFGEGIHRRLGRSAIEAQADVDQGRGRRPPPRWAVAAGAGHLWRRCGLQRRGGTAPVAEENWQACVGRGEGARHPGRELASRREGACRLGREHTDRGEGARRPRSERASRGEGARRPQGGSALAGEGARRPWGGSASTTEEEWRRQRRSWGRRRRDLAFGGWNRARRWGSEIGRASCRERVYCTV